MRRAGRATCPQPRPETAPAHLATCRAGAGCSSPRARRKPCGGVAPRVDGRDIRRSGSRHRGWLRDLSRLMKFPLSSVSRRGRERSRSVSPRAPVSTLLALAVVGCLATPSAANLEASPSESPPCGAPDPSGGCGGSGTTERIAFASDRDGDPGRLRDGPWRRQRRAAHDRPGTRYQSQVVARRLSARLHLRSRR